MSKSVYTAKKEKDDELILRC